MKKLSLGSIFLTIFFSVKVFADVNLVVDTPEIYRGDMAQITIIANGSNVEFPTIQEIAGYDVTPLGSSSRTININGKITRTIGQSYAFKPDKDVVIPPFTVKIRGDEHKTQEGKIKVLEPTASKDGDEYILEAIPEKNSLVEGESINFSLVFKRKIDTMIDALEIIPFDIKNLNFKQVGNIKTYVDGEYTVEKINFLITPLKGGEYEIPPFGIKVGEIVSTSLFVDYKWKKVYSKPFKLSVSFLPSGIINYGDFNIKASVDKHEVEVDEPVNLTLEIEGSGNIDDIEKFPLKMENVMIYSEKADVNENLKNNKFGGKFVQKFALVSDKDYTIPSFSFKFLDSKTNEIKTIKTNEINIKVNSKNISTKPKIETSDSTVSRSDVTTKVESKNSYFNLIIGFILGALVFFIAFKFRKKDAKKDMSIELLIKKSKSDKELFDILLPYAKKDETVDKALTKLEENLYKGSKHNIDKKELIEAMQRYFYVNE